MSFLNDCFDTMLEYGEAIKSSFVKGHVSDWPEEKEEEIITPEESKTEEPEGEDLEDVGLEEPVTEDPIQ